LKIEVCSPLQNILYNENNGVVGWVSDRMVDMEKYYGGAQAKIQNLADSSAFSCSDTGL
jgi:hypothetical protein